MNINAYYIQDQSMGQGPFLKTHSFRADLWDRGHFLCPHSFRTNLWDRDHFLKTYSFRINLWDRGHFILICILFGPRPDNINYRQQSSSIYRICARATTRLQPPRARRCSRGSCRGFSSEAEVRQSTIL